MKLHLRVHGEGLGYLKNEESLDEAVCFLTLYAIHYPVLKCICCTMCALLVFSTLDAGLLARSQYSEDPATGHRDLGFSWFPCA